MPTGKITATNAPNNIFKSKASGFEIIKLKTVKTQISPTSRANQSLTRYVLFTFDIVGLYQGCANSIFLNEFNFNNFVISLASWRFHLDAVAVVFTN